MNAEETKKAAQQKLGPKCWPTSELRMLSDGVSGRFQQLWRSYGLGAEWFDVPIENVVALAPREQTELGQLREWSASVEAGGKPPIKPLPARLPDGCCSAVSPCKFQREFPNDICSTCKHAREPLGPFICCENDADCTEPCVNHHDHNRFKVA